MMGTSVYNCSYVSSAMLFSKEIYFITTVYTKDYFFKTTVDISVTNSDKLK